MRPRDTERGTLEQQLRAWLSSSEGTTAFHEVLKQIDEITERSMADRKLDARIIEQPMGPGS